MMMNEEITPIAETPITNTDTVVETGTVPAVPEPVATPVIGASPEPVSVVPGVPGVPGVPEPGAAPVPGVPSASEVNFNVLYSHCRVIILVQNF